MADPNTPRPLKEWNEEIGPVLWWKFPVSEAPYVGTPHDLGQTVEAHTHAGVASRFQVGGWPGYHTHWTPLPPTPIMPTVFWSELARMKRATKAGERLRGKCAGKDILIWSDEHRAWWREDYSGYTIHRECAGVYRFEDAYAHTQHCGPEKKIFFQVVG